MSSAEDLNPQETAEWLQALDQVVEESGPDRASFLLDQLANRARVSGAAPSYYVNTPYVNTIPVQEQVPYPGDRALERRLKSLIRWNAMAMVVRANKYDHGIGGHISTYASLATLVEVGFNHFFRAAYGDQPGDLVYFQGHASPGFYARAFLEGRLNEKHLENFRHELREHPGLSSYPHPWLMPRFLAVPDGLDGSRSDQCHLPGALHALSGEPRAARRRRRARSGLSWATARRTSRNPPAPCASRPTRSWTT